MIEPFTVFRPKQATSVLYDSPHSGRYYPPSWKTLAAQDALRRGEDAYVDELLASSVNSGATLLIASYARCYIDLNRAEDDIDPEMLSDAWPGALSPSEKSRRGLGLVRRFVTPGVAVNAGPLASRVIIERIETVYRPYHEALDNLIREIKDARGTVLHVNWHSMKSRGNAMTPDGPGAIRPDFVVSDGHGTTSGPALVDTIVSSLRDRGFSVAINDPYSGGTIVKKSGRPEAGIHSVQVEINRALYLDERTVELKAGMAALASDIDDLTSRLTELEP